METPEKWIAPLLPRLILELRRAARRKSTRRRAMTNDTDSTAEDGIGDITLRLWKEGKSLTEISEESAVPLETVRRVLKEIQKKIVRIKQD